MEDDLADRDGEFFQRIDCRFPYNDPVAASALILEARAIADDACFAVLEEISRPPKSAKVPRGRQRELCDEWDRAVIHPLKPTVLPFANALINGRRMSPQACSAAMRTVAAYAGQWAALNILYFAAAGDDAAALSAMEELNASIKASWSAR